MCNLLPPAVAVSDLFDELQLRNLRQIYLDGTGFERDENGHLRSPFFSADIVSDGALTRVTFPADEDHNLKDELYLKAIRTTFGRIVELAPILDLRPPKVISGIYAFTGYDLHSDDERGHRWHTDFTAQPIVVRCGMVVQLTDATGVWTGGDFDLRYKSNSAEWRRFTHRANQGIAFNNEQLEHRVTPWTPVEKMPAIRKVLIFWLYW